MTTSDRTADASTPGEANVEDSSCPLPAMSGVSLLFVFLFFILVSIVSHIPYLNLSYVADDIGHLRDVGAVQVGVLSLGEFVWAGANEHFAPLWKLWYYFTWRCFGVAPLPWHLCVLVAHGVTAGLLFFLMRHYLNSNLGAWVGAYCWSVAAITGWDNPLSFISASHLIFGFLWLLAAMCCVTHFDGRSSTYWALGMAVCQSIAILNMGAMWVLTPILPAQYIILEYRRPVDRKRLATWILVWSIPFLVLGYIQTAATLPQVDLNNEFGAGPDLRRGVVRAAAEFQTTLASLWLRPVDHEERFDIKPAAAIGAVILALLFFIPKINRRFLLVSIGLCVVYTILVHMMRAYSDDRAMHWGRYAYIPILAWCTAIATVIALPHFHRTTFDRRCLAVILLVAIPFLTFKQYEFTRSTTETYNQEFSDAVATWNTNQRYFEQIAERASAENQAVVLIDFPIAVEPAITARTFHACLDLGEHHDLIEFVTPEQTDDEEHKLAVGLLMEVDNPQKDHWYVAIEHTKQIADFLQSVSERARDGDRLVLIPDIGVTIDQDHLRVSFLSKYIFYEGLLGIEYIDLSEVTPEIAEASTAFLAEVPGPVARDFEKVLAEIAGNNTK